MQVTKLAQSVQRLGYRLEDRRIVGEFPVGARHFSVVQNVQPGSGSGLIAIQAIYFLAEFKNVCNCMLYNVLSDKFILQLSFPFSSFTTYYSLIILPPEAIYPGISTSLNKT